MSSLRPQKLPHIRSRSLKTHKVLRILTERTTWWRSSSCTKLAQQWCWHKAFKIYDYSPLLKPWYSEREPFLSTLRFMAQYQAEQQPCMHTSTLKGSITYYRHLWPELCPWSYNTLPKLPLEAPHTQPQRPTSKARAEPSPNTCFWQLYYVW